MTRRRGNHVTFGCWRHGRARAAALLLALVASAGACKKVQPEDVPPPPAPLTMEVDKARSWLFTYVGRTGVFETVDSAEAVPEGARRHVRVVDPTRAPERGDGALVYVLDVEELLRIGRARARAMSRQAFETGALAQLPPGASSTWPRASGPAAPPAAEEGPEGAAPPAAAPPLGEREPVVTLYGTSWCGACKSARQFLRARAIPFVDKDIERDEAAARELAAKGARLGVPTDRVPILDVRGRLLLGFDKARLEALLGDAS